MESDKILLGILGLHIAIVAAAHEIIDELTFAAEGPVVVLMWASILFTLSGFFIGRFS